ncbi:hypothetical protein [Sulfobacillus thermosulfidooxidans]|uniref:hypothetical protein n=1 Tax=Sulfobacillus thermosulfidooxidans TaxID=28034 RepID=UPI0006B68D0C|nr:hypothetical protein [Sulfobacillus thermosulfidooxidans]
MSDSPHPIGSSHGIPGITETSRRPAVSEKPSRFDTLLQQKLIVSQHAQDRMQTRDIHLSARDANQLSQAIDEVNKKGSRQAAIIMGSHIFIVAPPSRTIITSLESPENGMKVITQVDAVVYVSRTSDIANSARHLNLEEASSTRQTASTPTPLHWSLLSMPNAEE